MTTMISLFVMKLQLNHAHSHRHRKVEKREKNLEWCEWSVRKRQTEHVSTELFYLKAPNGKK